MAGIENTLYPPVVDSYIPAFIRTDICRIYFSLSIYNSAEDIKNVQIIVNNQYTNISMLKNDKYPSEIKIADLHFDPARAVNPYYIEISPEDLINGFELNEFYKVQIRFTHVNATAIPEDGKIESWLVENRNYFSEWSRVCLIRGIEQPKIYLKGFKDDITQATFTIEVVDLVGKMYFDNEAEEETLKSYSFKIYDNVLEELLHTTEEIYTQEYNPNEINYTLTYRLNDVINYRLELNYTTEHGYKGSKEYVFMIIQTGLDKLDAKIEAIPRLEDGTVEIYIHQTDFEPDKTKVDSFTYHLDNENEIKEKDRHGKGFSGSVTIRRTSSETNFTIWEDIYTFTLANQPLNYEWRDKTIKSGVWYKYGVQRRNALGHRGILTVTKEPIMLVLDDMFLLHNNLQVNIKFNPVISAYKHVVSETKTDTIGSKYPYVRRNGHMDYRQFTITGLISAFSDEQGLYLNRDNIYKENRHYYDQYNYENRISDYRDFTYEREFREKVTEFLYANTVKLFRSPTEGNILVKLMNISFTPNKTLGRLVYNFTATANEVDECTIENYDFYNIQPIGTYSPQVQFDISKTVSLSGTFANENIIADIDAKNKYETIYNNYTREIRRIKWLRIEFQDDPYLIGISADGSMTPILDNRDLSEFINTVYGYLVSINNNLIMVSSLGRFELNDIDTEIKELSFPTPTEVLITYDIIFIEKEDLSKIARELFYKIVPGQLWGAFAPNESIVTYLAGKYHRDMTRYYQKLLAVTDLTIETEPGAVIWLKDSDDDTFYKHVVGSTGVLHFYEDDTILTDCYFGGIQLYRQEEGVERRDAEDSKFIETGIEVDFEALVVDPIKNGIYIINGEPMIFYHREWYPVTVEQEIAIVECPIIALIDYVAETVKGEY